MGNTKTMDPIEEMRKRMNGGGTGNGSGAPTSSAGSGGDPVASMRGRMESGEGTSTLGRQEPSPSYGLRPSSPAGGRTPSPLRDPGNRLTRVQDDTTQQQAQAPQKSFSSDPFGFLFNQPKQAQQQTEEAKQPSDPTAEAGRGKTLPGGQRMETIDPGRLTQESGAEDYVEERRLQEDIERRRRTQHSEYRELNDRLASGELDPKEAEVERNALDEKYGVKNPGTAWEIWESRHDDYLHAESRIEDYARMIEYEQDAITRLQWEMNEQAFDPAKEPEYRQRIQEHEQKIRELRRHQLENVKLQTIDRQEAAAREQEAFNNLSPEEQHYVTRNIFEKTWDAIKGGSIKALTGLSSGADALINFAVGDDGLLDMLSGGAWSNLLGGIANTQGNPYTELVYKPNRQTAAAWNAKADRIIGPDAGVQLAANATTAVEMMLPYILLNAYLSSAAAASTPSAAASAMRYTAAINTATSSYELLSLQFTHAYLELAGNVSAQYTFMQEYGNGLLEAEADGADKKQAALYALYTATLNTIIEYSGGVEGVNAELSRNPYSALSPREMVSTIFHEDLEELAQGFVGDAFKAVYQEVNYFSGDDPVISKDKIVETLINTTIATPFITLAQVGVTHGFARVSARVDARNQRAANQIISTLDEAAARDQASGNPESDAELIRALEEISSNRRLSRVFEEMYKTSPKEAIESIRQTERAELVSREVSDRERADIQQRAETALRASGVENPGEAAQLIAKQVMGEELTRDERRALKGVQQAEQVSTALQKMRNLEQNARYNQAQQRRKDIKFEKKGEAQKLRDVKVKGGKTATVTKATMEKGKLALEVEENGKTRVVSTEDLELDSSQRQALDTLTRVLGKDAAAAYNGLDLGKLHFGNAIDMMEYATAWANVRDLFGYKGASIEAARAATSTWLTEEQVQQAYNVGKQMKERGESRTEAREGSKRGSGEISMDGLTITNEDGSKTTLEGVKDRETVANSREYKTLEALAKALDIDVVLFEGDASNRVNGAYVDGTIYLDWSEMQRKIEEEGGDKWVAFRVMGHELTHFIQQNAPELYDELKDFITSYLSDKMGKDFNELVNDKMQREFDANGRTLSYEAAVDEVIADACETMLRDSQAVRQMMREHMTLWEKICDFFDSILKKIQAQDDAAKLLEPVIEQVQEIWDRGLAKAVESRETALENLSEGSREIVESLGEDATVETDKNGDMTLAKSEDGHTMAFSMKTWDEIGRDKLTQALRENGHTQEEIDAVIENIEATGDFLEKLAEQYADSHDYQNLKNNLWAGITTNLKTGKQIISALVNNGDYPVNIDLQLICKKRVAYMRMLTRLIDDGVFEKVDFKGAAIADLNAILRDGGFETACLGCFVESRRLQLQAWAETIVEEWNDEVDKRKQNAGSFNFAQGGNKLSAEDILNLSMELESAGKKNDKGNLNLGKGGVKVKMGRLLDKVPSLAQHLTVADLLTPDGLKVLRAYDQNLFSLVKQRYGAASPKIVQDFNPYNSEMADLSFKFVKQMIGESVTGSKKYTDQAKKELPQKKGESTAEYNRRVDTLAVRKYLYDIGGARIQSFSDFMIENVFDYMQIIADLSARELPLHGYSKEAVFLRLFGMTGGKFNGSLIAHVEGKMGKEYAGLLPVEEASNGRGLVVEVDGKKYAICFDDYARHAATGSFIQSIGLKDIVALQMDPRYSKNVGSITIGVSDKQILAMLDSPYFRMVIPYHASGMIPEFAKLVGVSNYNDYTDYQTTRVNKCFDLKGNPVEGFWKADGKKVEIDTHFDFNEAVQRLGDARAAAQEYLDWCKQRHPVYDGKKKVGYAIFTAKFSDSPYGTDFTTHENYYKLLEDFNSYDSIGEASALQGAVTMTLPSEANRLTPEQMDAYKQALRDTGLYTEKEIAKYAKKADMTFQELIAEEVGNRADYESRQAKVWDETVDKAEQMLLEKYGREEKAAVVDGSKVQLSVKDAEYVDAVKRGDMETAQKMVDEAAKAAGYTVKAFHGTRSFGFTVFDPSRADDGISLFATSNRRTAETYSGETNRNRIKDRETKNADDLHGERLIEEARNHKKGYQDYKLMSDKDKANVRDDAKSSIGWSIRRAQEFVRDHRDAFDSEKAYIMDRLISSLYHLRDSETEADISEAWTEWEDALWDLKGMDDSIAIEFLEDVDSRGLFQNKNVLDDMTYQGDMYADWYAGGPDYIFDNQLQIELNAEYHKGIYELWCKPGKQLVFDANGENWNQITTPKELQDYGLYGPQRTRDIASAAKALGYDSVLMRNLRDNGGETAYNGISDVYIFFDASALKSADPVTYDDKGNVIPLSERFDSSKSDIRFSVRSDAKTDRELLKDAYQQMLRDKQAVIDQYGKQAKEDLEKYQKQAEKYHLEEAKVTEALDKLDKAVQAGDGDAVKALREELNAAEGRMTTALKQLSQLQERPALQQILQRERAIERTRTRERIREGVNRRDLRQRVERLWKDMNRRITSPTEKKHIPVPVMQQAIEVLQALNMDTSREGTKSGEKLRSKLTELKARYEALQKDPDYRQAAMYDEQVAEYLTNMIEQVGDTPINKMSVAQLETVYRTLTALDHVARHALKLKLGEEERSAYEVSQAMTRETRSVPKAKTGLAAAWLNAQLSAERMFRRLGGYHKNSTWEQVYRMLNDGQLRQTQIQMEGSMIFADLLAAKDYGKFVDPNATVDIGLKDEDGNPVKITHGMMVSLWMHLQNEQNRRHVAFGGLTIPGLKDYYNGKKVKGSERAIRIGGALQELAEINDRLQALEESDSASADEIAELEAQRDEVSVKAIEYVESLQESIEKQLTDYDRQWIAACRELFDGLSKRVLNQTTLEVYGIKRANVENYFPIWVDGDFLNTPFETVARDLSLENAGFMKERVDSSKPIRLADVSDVAASQIRKVSQYAGLMPAIRNFGKVWGKTQTGYRDSLRKAVHETFGQNGVNYIEHLMADLNGARSKENDAVTEFFNRMRGHMAQASLTMSLRVAMGQTASYPTAAAVVGWKALHKALWRGGRNNWLLSRADKELIQKYSPLLYYRMKGYSNTELGDIAGMNDKWSRLWKKARWLTGWIQAMDGATVGRLWYAAEYYVQDHNKDLQKGTDAYYETVAKVFNDIVERTQPNYSTMQRPDILRNPSSLVKQLTMFLTQRLQNFNILYDAFATHSTLKADYKAGRNGVTLEDVRQAAMETRRACVSQVAAGITITVFKTLADIALHSLSAYRDDDDKELKAESISWELLDMFIDSMTGNVLGGSELWDIAESLIPVFNKTYYGIEVSGMAVVQDMISASMNLFTKITKGEATGKDYENVIRQFCTVLGIPYANGKKFFNAGKYWIQDAVNGEWLWESEAGVDRTTAMQAHRLYRAYQDKDFGKVNKIRGQFPEDKQKDLDEAVRTYIKQQYKDGEITVYEAMRQLQSYGNASPTVMANFIKEQYADGNLQKGDAVKYLVEYAGRSQESAEKTVRELSAERDTGVKYSEINDQYMMGEISGQQATQMLVDYGGKDPETAALMVEFWDFQNKHPGSEMEFSQYQTYTNKYKPIGLSPEQYEDYARRMKDCKGVDADGDGKTDSGSKKIEVVALIDSMDLTPAQKDLMYLANNYSESGLKDCPWNK